MKKIFIALFVLLLSACSLGVANTPKEKVKEFLDKYKNQDSEVISDLENTVSSEYSGEYKDRYITIMKNQYKNMKYDITDEIIEGDTATVVAEITVYNYGAAIESANSYLSTNREEFLINSSDETSRDDNESDDGLLNDNNLTSEIDNDKFTNYKLNELENVTDTKTYSIEFTLTKKDNTWVMNSLSETDIEKLHGLYNE